MDSSLSMPEMTKWFKPIRWQDYPDEGYERRLAVNIGAYPGDSDIMGEFAEYVGEAAEEAMHEFLEEHKDEILS